MTENRIGAADILLLSVCGFLGIVGGRRIGLPAAIITGPVLMSVLVHSLGWTEAQPPDWLISVAQVVIGLGLAMRFKGLERGAMARGLLYGGVTVVIMLGTGTAISGALSLFGEKPLQVLLMCFAPGGVVEMGLIALSLGVSPLIVTFHHILRIMLTVIVVPVIARRVLPG